MANRPVWLLLALRRGACCVLVFWLVWPVGAVASQAVELVYGPPDAPRALRLHAGGAEETVMPDATPLGSVWKLFVYAWLIDQDKVVPDYRCTGRQVAEEAYCCAPGESIGREAALAKSCGLFFAPQRLGIDARQWRQYWSQRSSPAPDWLLRLEAMQPETVVSVPSLLAALAALDGPARARSMRALQKALLEPRARSLLSHLGSQLRGKTWSWRDGKGQRIGGMAGWLADGRPFWLRGSGTSAPVIERAAPWLARHVPVTKPAEDACVRVRFFNRYPLAKAMHNGQPAEEGALTGKVAVHFANGQRLDFAGSSGLGLRRTSGGPVIEGRFGLNDYVARVIQREGAASPSAAGRALAVAARTYLVRHAGFAGGCYEMADDSRTQRVAAAPPEPAALAAAEWSDGFILSGVAGRYHLEREAPQQLAWRSAVRWAGEGSRWDEILERAYGSGGFALVGDADAAECKALSAVESWLAARQSAWKRELAAMPGFEMPQTLPRVCLLEHGRPYADVGRNRIYATGIATANERLTVTHEFLHIALRHHPRGRDEEFIERTARKLLKLS